MFIHILKNIIVVSTTSADDYFLSTDILLYMQSNVFKLPSSCQKTSTTNFSKLSLTKG